jgi:hypothetical protein
VANRIFYEGANLLDFRVELAMAGGLVLVLLLLPLTVFVPTLIALKRRGLREYGVLASRFSAQFDRKWIRQEGGPAGASLVESSDVQSLADLANSFAVVRSIRVFPLSPEALLVLATITAAPMMPLVLTMLPLDTIVARLLGMFF